METIILIAVGILAALMLPFIVLFLAALIAFEMASKEQLEEEWKAGQK